LNSALNAIEDEYKFGIMRNDQEYTFNLFKVNTDEPRPESYNEDVETASHFSDEADKAKIYVNKASAAESRLTYKMECVLVELYTPKNDSEKTEVYRKYSQDRKKAINDVLWSERMNYWADFDMGQNKLDDEHFFVFGLSPLWFGINAPNKTANEVVDANAGYIQIGSS
jgi:neutral trehalase